MNYSQTNRTIFAPPLLTISIMSSSNKNKPTLESLKEEVLRLQHEKQKLESELKSREEMMSNLLAFIENVKK